MSKNGRVGLVLSGTETVSSEYEELDRVEAHRNRRQQMKAKSMRELMNMLSREFGRKVRRNIESELDRRFRNLYKLRMKG